MSRPPSKHLDSRPILVDNPSEAIHNPINCPNPGFTRPSTSSSQLECKSSKSKARLVLKSKIPVQLVINKTAKSTKSASVKSKDCRASHQASSLFNEEEESLHIYIKELENLLRKEKLKRIHSEQMLEKYKYNDTTKLINN